MVEDLTRALLEDDYTLFEVVEQLVVAVTENFGLHVQHTDHGNDPVNDEEVHYMPGNEAS